MRVRLVNVISALNEQHFSDMLELLFIKLQTHKRATPLAPPVGSASVDRRQADLGSSPRGEAQSLRRPAAPSRLRARAESSPAIGRNERGEIGFLYFRLSEIKGSKPVSGCGIVCWEADA